MRAQYILAAIAAMREVDAVKYLHNPEALGKAYARLVSACIDLEVHSGLSLLDVTIEPDQKGSA